MHDVSTRSTGLQGLVFGCVPSRENIILCWLNTQNICTATSKMISPSTFHKISANNAEHNTNLRHWAVHFSFPLHESTCLVIAHEKTVLQNVSLKSGNEYEYIPFNSIL